MPTDESTFHRTVRRADHSTIAYTTKGAAGTGSVWVLIHGWGCRRRDFDALSDHLPAEHRSLAIDLAGHGDSTSTRDAWTMQEFALDVAAVLAAEGVDRAVVAGHSLGGAVAVEVARLLPDVVDHVVGIDSFHYLTLYPAIGESAIRAVMSGFETDFPAAVRGLVTMGSTPDADPAFDEEVFAKMSSVSPDTAVPALEELLRWDMDRALENLAAPVTVIAAQAKLDLDARERYGDRIRFVVEDLGGHHFLVEAPERTATLMLAAAS